MSRFSHCPVTTVSTSWTSVKSCLLKHKHLFFYCILWNVSRRWLKHGYVSHMAVTTISFSYMQTPRLVEFYPSLPKIFGFLHPISLRLYNSVLSSAHEILERQVFPPKSYKAKTGQRLDRRFVSRVHCWPVQSTHSNQSCNPGALLHLLSEINLTYYVISKANGAEGDKCKVDSFTVGPTLCDLEEQWWQTQEH